MDNTDQELLGAGTGAAELGIGAVTGNPLAIMMGVTSLIGTGISIFGAKKQADNSAQIAGIEAQIEGINLDVNSQRQQQFTLETNRQQLQNIRNAQRQRSVATTRAVNQGAQFGSGLQGGYGQISGEENTNKVALSQNQQIGNKIFSDYAQEDAFKMQIAQLQGNSAKYQGLAAIGAGISSAAGPLSRMAYSFFPKTNSSPNFGVSGGSVPDMPSYAPSDL